MCEPCGPCVAGMRRAFSMVKKGEKRTLGSSSLRRCSVKAVGSVPFDPSGRSMMRRLLRRFWFSVSSAQLSRAFTLAFSVCRSPVCSRTVSIADTRCSTSATQPQKGV